MDDDIKEFPDIDVEISFDDDKKLEIKNFQVLDDDEERLNEFLNKEDDQEW